MVLVLDRFVFEMGLDPKDFVKGQRETVTSFRKTREAVVKDGQGIETAAEKAAASVDRLFRNFVKLFALVTTGRSLSGFVSEVTNADAALGRLATSIGRAPELISAMSKAVERSGGDAQAAVRSFQSWSEQVERIRTTGDSSILPFLARLQAAGGKTIDLNKKNVDGLADLADNLKAVAEQQGIASATYYGKNLGFDEGTIALLVKGGAALRKAIQESEKLGIATSKDTAAAQELQTAYRTLTQEVESFGRTILTAISPVLVQLLKDVQAVVRAIKEWVQSNVVPFLKEFASQMGIAGSETLTLVRITEALFALWLGSKAIAFLRVLGTMRLLLTGGRVAAGGALAGSSGLLGAIIGGLAVGGTIGADRSTPNAEKPGLQKHWDDEASGAAPGGMWDAVKRGWNWGKRKLFGGGDAGAAPGAAGGGAGAAAGSGPVSTLPIAPGTGDGHIASREERAKYIREAAVRNGIDPDVALRVAQSEGFNKYTGDQGRSHGDWQLFTGGGLGNKALAEGIDVRDPKTWKEQTDFAMREAARGGWRPWHGAAKAGIGDWQGITRKGPQADAPAPAARNDGVDARLTDIIENAKKSLPEGYTAKIVSGLRPGDRRFHGQGLASDVAIYDPQGRKLGNYQDASTFRQYEQFAQAARRYQMQKYPELAKALRWGGYFGGPAGKYGALDTMHFDLGGHRVGMGGGSWAEGLTREQRQMFPGANSQGMGQDAPRSPSARLWRGSPAAVASVNQARNAQAAQIGRQMNDNRSSTTTTNSTRIGSVTVQTAATDAGGIARDMEEALKRRSFVAAATTGQA
ncbi:hypothetical protein VQ02_19940 [Methylobacterium variabile]|uniref:Phage tail lysozyme domain-containing protein n=1 Tax=Methylobacterium variabile TaxID=298794 RepID=A0A0J6SFA5_9HYPH|nr:hypothetical protein [Methylobacterium variabile]KMO33910.1 hypothetical protein VQ02_19940 [Methylobacterium variabile]